MKGLLLSAFFFNLLNFPLKAQVPNADFTCWNFNPGPPPHDEPCGWTSPGLPICVFKTTDSYTDSFALEVRTLSYVDPFPPYDTLVQVGNTMTGANYPNGPYGFPFTQRPNNFCAWVKYSSQGLDSAEIKIKLYKWNVALQIPEDVAQAKFYVSANSAAYQQRMATFQYFPPFTTSGNPDTACVYISSSHQNDTVAGDIIKVDNIILMNNCLSAVDDVDETHQQPLFYPNPADNMISFSSLPYGANRIKVFEVTGKLVATEAVENSFARIDIKSLTPGIYLFGVNDENNKVISSGKFSVVR